MYAVFSGHFSFSAETFRIWLSIPYLLPLLLPRQEMLLKQPKERLLTASFSPFELKGNYSLKLCSPCVSVLASVIFALALWLLWCECTLSPLWLQWLLFPDYTESLTVLSLLISFMLIFKKFFQHNKKISFSIFQFFRA